MDDYYSYKPLLKLPRPLAICGLPGTKVGRTVRAMNLVSGVPFVWLDRRVEHELGASVELVHVRDGLEARLAVERRILATLGDERSPPYVALSQVTMSDPDLRTRVLQSCDVVVLDISIAEAELAVQQEAEADQRKHYALLRDVAESTDTLARRLERMATWYQGIVRRIPVARRAPMTVAQDVIDRFAPRPA
jgi:shikimate kinase